MEKESLGPCLELAHLRGTETTFEPGATLGPRICSDHEVVLMREGTAQYEAGGKSYEAPPGVFVLGRKGVHERYLWDPHRRTRHGFFHFVAQRWPDYLPPPEQWPVVVSPPEDNMAEPLFDYILTHGASPGAGVRGAPSSLITRFVEALLGVLLQGPLTGRRQAGPAPLELAADRVRGWLRDGCPGTLQLRDLAAAGGVSAKHLCRLAQQWWGMGPMEMARRMRLEAGLNLLTRTNLPVQEVARHCGFVSPYHFSRRFRAVYGISPRDARGRAAEGAPL